MYDFKANINGAGNMSLDNLNVDDHVNIEVQRACAIVLAVPASS